MSRKVINVFTNSNGNSSLLLNFNPAILEDSTMATPESETEFKLTELGIETVLGMSIENYKKNRDNYTNATVKTSIYMGDVLYATYYYICELMGSALVQEQQKYMYQSKAMKESVAQFDLEINFDTDDNLVSALITLTAEE